MLKSILVLIITVFIFSGCHRYHHNIHARIIPTIVVPTILFGVYDNHPRQQRHQGGHRNRHKHYR